jgi:hypothetical protein
VAGSCECDDEPSGCVTTELVLISDFRTRLVHVFSFIPCATFATHLIVLADIAIIIFGQYCKLQSALILQFSAVLCSQTSSVYTVPLAFTREILFLFIFVFRVEL